MGEVNKNRLSSIRFLFGGNIVFETKIEVTEIDKEWLQLIIEAKNLGIEKKEILDYLNQKI
ncbi:DNA-binding anti-repressor SinI [Cytobacillus praedii]|uniref:DNA-binding anti-repressor SinI n=1 Tax=Cytobacillus praedii TaxID=1742358 RepID=A0A4R1B363_9BACI|nr:DNA-binding anti-repressor SinI [Cytobacillus praedii]